MRHRISERLSIRNKILFVFLPLQLVLMLCFGMLVNAIYRQLTEQWLNDELSLQAEYAAEAVDSLMADACSILNHCYVEVNPQSNNSETYLLKKIIDGDSLNAVEVFELYEDVLNPFFSAYYRQGKTLLRIYLPDGYVPSDGRYVASLCNCLQDSAELGNYDPAKIHWRIDPGRQTISLFRILTTRDGGHVGILSYEINFSVISRLLSLYLDPEEVSYAFDLFSEGARIRIAGWMGDGVEAICTHATTFRSGSLKAAYKQRPFRAVNRQLTIILWLLIATALVLSGLLSVLFSGTITGRMQRLMQRIHLLRDGKDADIPITGADEVAMLDRYITELVRELDHRFMLEQQALLKNKNLEIQMLQLQFKPHFLYNTLSAIRWSVLKTGNQDVAKIIEGMVDMYRLTLNNGESIVSVHKEIRIVQCYLEISAFAYDKKYELDVRVDKAMLNDCMPKCVLQPLVENAVKYAYDSSVYLRKIALSGHTDGEVLTFEVRDFGKGFPRELLEWAEAGRMAPVPGAGFGLSNLCNRMRSIFGEKGCIHIANAQDGGALIQLSFPAIREEAGNGP